MSWWYAILLAWVVAQRLVELRVSAANREALLSSGAQVHDSRFSYACMVALHSLWILGCVVEPVLRSTEVAGTLVVGASIAFVGAQILRVWALRTLGWRWNTRVTLPQDQRELSSMVVCDKGPYRFIRHPNYTAVIVEILALPLVAGAYWTAALASVANALVLVFRIKIEEQALFESTEYRAHMAALPRFFPRLRCSKAGEAV